MITLWHNPRCSKSRQALKLLEDAGAEITLRRYLEDAPTIEELQKLRDMLDRPAIDMVRRNEPEFRAAGLSADSDDETLFRAMAETPKLIERPVAIKGTRAVIGRPPEEVLSLL